jgi:hypothetical protein
MRGNRRAGGDDPISGVAALPADNALVAHATNNQIVRLSAGGSRTVVAGNGQIGLTGDGGPAIAADIGPLGRVASFRDGSFVFAQRDVAGDWVIRRVDAVGAITTVAGGGPGATDEGCLPDRIPATSVSFREIGDLLALGGGDILFVDRNAGLLHVSSAGQLTQILCGSPGPNDHRHDANPDGRRADEAFVDALSSVAMTSDRTLLIGGDAPDGGYVAMLSPNGGGGRRLGVALTPETHAAITQRGLVLHATHAATVKIRLVHRRRTVSTLTTRVARGRTVLRLHDRVPPGENTVFVSAHTSDGRVAADLMRTIVPGPRGVGVGVMRRLIFRELERRSNTVDPKLEQCRAISRQTVTCRLRDDPEDLPGGIRERWTVRRTADGVLHATVSNGDSFVIQP